MKRILFTVLVLTISWLTMAGGLLTNTNQSTQFVRTLSRNASTDVDAVYFNPAGLTKLDNGFYLALHNQTIFQTRTITNDFYLLNNDTYKGEVSVPLFPTGFAVYKMDRLAFSLGFGPNAGGGAATYENGLPSFEIPIAQNIPALSALSALGYPVEAYDVNIRFEGTSVFWGIQLGASFKVNDMISVYAGARYLPARNNYSGYLKDIQYGPTGGLQNGQSYLSGAAATATGMSNVLGATATSLDPLVTGGAADFTIDQAQQQNLIDATTAAQLKGALLQLGVPASNVDAMNLASVQGTFSTASTQLSGQATVLNVTASMLDDKEVDVSQTGAGFTPILSMNITPLKNLNIGMKYEFLTKLELTNNTKIDGTGMFPDGAVTQSDIPAFFAIGAEYGLNDKTHVSVSFNQYFDKKADWNGREDKIDHGLWEVGVGLEYDITNWLLVSAGYLHGETGIMPDYQTDMSFSNSSDTFGGGFKIGLTPTIDLNMGILKTYYTKNQREYSLDGFPNSITETYTKSNIAFSLGIDIKLF